MIRRSSFISAILFLCTIIATAYGESTVTINVGRDDVTLYVPDDYDKENPLPLIVALHGFTANSQILDRMWKLSKFVDYKQFILCLPNGTRNSRGSRFWNATEACCDMEGSGIDDDEYLMSLVELIESEYAVDPQSIHFAGHSNGGFMSYHMACKHADKIASIASLSGAMYIDAEAHSPSEPVHVLQIHGNNDTVVDYDGGCWGGACFPSARESIEMWAEFNNCDMTPKQAEPFDLVRNVEGAETIEIRFEPKGKITDAESSKILSDGLPVGAIAELWTIQGGGHVPSFNATFGMRLIDWLLTHRKVISVTN